MGAPDPNSENPAAYKGDKPYAFVCYAIKDKIEVYKHLHKLNSLGVRLWYDAEGIDASDSASPDWADTIADSIEKCSLFLFFVTEASVKSKHCDREAKDADNLGKDVRCIYLREIKLSRGLRTFFGSKQGLNFYDVSPETYWRKLADVCRKADVMDVCASYIQSGSTAKDDLRLEEIGELAEKEERNAKSDLDTLSEVSLNLVSNADEVSVQGSIDASMLNIHTGAAKEDILAEETNTSAEKDVEIFATGNVGLLTTEHPSEFIDASGSQSKERPAEHFSTLGNLGVSSEKKGVIVTSKSKRLSTTKQLPELVESAKRSQYTPSGRVNWVLWVLCTLGGIFISILVGIFSGWLYSCAACNSSWIGLSTFPLTGTSIFLYHAMRWAQCRNRSIGWTVGGICGVASCIGFLLDICGDENLLTRPDHLTFLPLIISIYFVVATLFFGVGAVIATEDVYSEKEGCWARRDIMFYSFSNAEIICSIFLGKVAIDPDLPLKRILQPGSHPATVVLIEYFRRRPGKGYAPKDIVYVSVCTVVNAIFPLVVIPGNCMIRQVSFTGGEVNKVLGIGSSGRSHYKASGRVNWKLWLPSALGGICIAIPMGIFSGWLNISLVSDSTYFVVSILGLPSFLPFCLALLGSASLSIFASIIICIYLDYAMKWAQCRNPWVGWITGGMCGIAMSICFYYAFYDAGNFFGKAEYTTLLGVSTLLTFVLGTFSCGRGAAMFAANVFLEEEEGWAQRDIIFFPPSKADVICSIFFGEDVFHLDLPLKRIPKPGKYPATVVFTEYARKHNDGSFANDEIVYVSVYKIVDATKPLLAFPSNCIIKQVAFTGKEVNSALGTRADQPQWYYARNARNNLSRGPVSEDEINNLLTSGAIHPEELVWTEGMENWAPANTVAHLDKPPFSFLDTIPDSQDVEKNWLIAFMAIVPALFWLPLLIGKDSILARYYSKRGLWLLIGGVFSSVIASQLFSVGIFIILMLLVSMVHYMTEVATGRRNIEQTMYAILLVFVTPSFLFVILFPILSRFYKIF